MLNKMSGGFLKIGIFAFVLFAAAFAFSAYAEAPSFADGGAYLAHGCHGGGHHHYYDRGPGYCG